MGHLSAMQLASFKKKRPRGDVSQAWELILTAVYTTGLFKFDSLILIYKSFRDSRDKRN